MFRTTCCMLCLTTPTHSSPTIIFYLAIQIGVVTKFMRENKNYLRQFENSYCLTLNAGSSVQKNEAVFDALRIIGITLALRDVSDLYL